MTVDDASRRQSADDLLQKVLERSVVEHVHRLARWLRSSDTALSFCADNFAKIRKKFRRAKTREDVFDVVAELDVACLLLTLSRASIEYEPGGGGGPGPDFIATLAGAGRVCVEVRRIREGDVTARMDGWSFRMRQLVRSIPGSVWVSVKATGFPEYASIRTDHRVANREAVSRLEAAEPALAEWVRDRVACLEPHLLPGGPSVQDEPPFLRGDVVFTFCRHAEETLSRHCRSGGNTVPILYDGQEAWKLRSVIEDKLRQIRRDELNVVAIVGDSSTHEPADMPDATHGLWSKLLKDKNDTLERTRLDTMDDVETRWRSLSGVVMIESAWGKRVGDADRDANFLWTNADANVQLPAEVAAHLRTMTRPN